MTHAGQARSVGSAAGATPSSFLPAEAGLRAAPPSVTKVRGDEETTAAPSSTSGSRCVHRPYHPHRDPATCYACTVGLSLFQRAHKGDGLSNNEGTSRYGRTFAPDGESWGLSSASIDVYRKKRDDTLAQQDEKMSA